ncbi:MAG TPA: hypothetical protein VIK14_16865 [Ignavibacteria bacterium]
MPFKPAKCPSCGGDLQVPEEKDIIICMYCGTNVIVREAIKIAVTTINSNVNNLLKLATDAQDSYNLTEAYNYFNKVLEIEINNTTAWLGKAHCAGFMSTAYNFRSDELILGIDNSIIYSKPEEIENIKIKASDLIIFVCHSSYLITSAELKEYRTKFKFDTLLNNLLTFIHLLERAFELNPNSLISVSKIIFYNKQILDVNELKYYDYSDLDIYGNARKKYYYIDSLILENAKKYLIKYEAIKKTLEPSTTNHISKKPKNRYNIFNVNTIIILLFIIVSITLYLLVKNINSSNKLPYYEIMNNKDNDTALLMTIYLTDTNQKYIKVIGDSIIKNNDNSNIYIYYFNDKEIASNFLNDKIKSKSKNKNDNFIQSNCFAKMKYDLINNEIVYFKNINNEWKIITNY